MILSDEEIGKITEQCQGADWTYQLVRGVEAEILDRLKAQKPVAWVYEYTYDLNGDKQGNWPVENHTSVCFCETKPNLVAAIPLYPNPIPADDVVRQRDELLAALSDLTSTVGLAIDGATGWDAHKNARKLIARVKGETK